MMDPTPAQTRAFWDQMMRAYNTRITPKTHAPEMRITARILDTLGVLSRDDFVHRYTTVWGRRIYPCFIPGEPPDLWSQIVVCTHEHQHVEQLQRLGWPRFASQYLLSSRQRALLEADAYATNIELHFWRHGSLPDPTRHVEVLKDYACNQADRDAAHKLYQDVLRALPQEGPSRPATLRAISILEGMGLRP